MKPATVIISCLALCCVFAGCSKQREISGEVFSHDFKKGIVKESGTLVCFLTAQEHDRFDELVKGSRDRHYQHDRQLWDRSHKEYMALFDKHKRDDGKVYGSDAGEEVMDKLKALESAISEAKTNIEQKVYDREISFDDEGREQLKQLMASVHRTTADAEGKFKVILSIGTEYWIVAEAQILSARWYFRYVPDGTPLILSDGNAM
jgi:gas vesicle protein